MLELENVGADLTQGLSVNLISSKKNYVEVLNFNQVPQALQNTGGSQSAEPIPSPERFVGSF